MGGQAVGSAVWGVLASVTSLSVAMEIAAGLLFLGGLSVSVLPLHDGAVLDRSVVHFWAEPVLMFEPRPTDGPVLVTVEYRVPADRHAAFIHAIAAVEQSRRRTGASRWGLFQDTADPDQFIWRPGSRWSGTPSSRNRRNARISLRPSPRRAAVRCR